MDRNFREHHLNLPWCWMSLDMQVCCPKHMPIYLTLGLQSFLVTHAQCSWYTHAQCPGHTHTHVDLDMHACCPGYRHMLNWIHYEVHQAQQTAWTCSTCIANLKSLDLGAIKANKSLWTCQILSDSFALCEAIQMLCPNANTTISVNFEALYYFWEGGGLRSFKWKGH